MKKYLFISFFIFNAFGFSQDQDAVIWTGFEVSKKITKKTSLAFESQTRFYKNATVLGNVYGELKVKHEILKRLDASIYYRFGSRDREDYYQFQNRLAINLAYSYKIKDLNLRFKVRTRYQYRFENGIFINDFNVQDQKSVFRTKFNVKYTIPNYKRLSPYASFEFYNRISNQFNKSERISPIDKYRFNVGLAIDLPKRNAIDVFFMYEKANRSVPRENFIYCIQYSYDLKGKLIKNKSKSNTQKGKTNLKTKP